MLGDFDPEGDEGNGEGEPEEAIGEETDEEEAGGAPTEDEGPGGDETEEEEEPLLAPPSRAPVPQGILSPLGWTVSVGGVEPPEASAMVNRVVQ